MRPEPDRCPYCFGIGNHAPDFDCRPRHDPQPARHILKTWPEPFAALSDGSKTFEYRKDDRGYRMGDMLVLRKWDPTLETTLPLDSTPAELIRWVTYIVRGPGFGIPDGYCVMSVSERRPA
jgi:hypothetical protein